MRNVAGEVDRSSATAWLDASLVDHLDANSWRRGHSRPLGQVTVRRQLVGGVRGHQRCCTYVLYGGCGLLPTSRHRVGKGQMSRLLCPLIGG
jgi:hypothetical protein